MMKRARPLRKLLLAGAVATAMMVAACASDPAGSNGSAGASGSTHTGHDTSAAAAALPLRAGERFVNLTMPEPYTPTAPQGGTDEYRCLILDPQLTTPTFLSGSQFQPQNTPMVHHAVVFAVPPENAAAAHAKDAATPGQGWTCFGTAGRAGPHPSAWVDTWAPGATETLLQQDVGYQLQPGSLLVVQIHYNLLAAGPGDTDQSGLRLRLTDGTPATKPLVAVPFWAPTELPCASGESGPLCDRAAAIADVTQRFGDQVGGFEDGLVSACSGGTPTPGNTQHCDVPIPEPLTVYAAFGHMHLLGRSIKVELNPDTPQAQTLLDVPNFDFDHQRLQPMPAPVDVNPGDTVRVTCTHDATLRQKLPQLSQLPPRYVVWGDGTTDEMCLGLLTATAR
jgi:hypothetical protein